MVSAHKLPAALFAIHSVLVKARWLAGERVEHEKLYQFLDWAELLPALVSGGKEDTTEDFRQTLAGLAIAFPECAGLVRNFDQGITWKIPGPSGDS